MILLIVYLKITQVQVLACQVVVCVGAYGLNNYSNDAFKDWLDLYNRNVGSDPSKGERANVVDYVNRCKDVAGYEYLKKTKAAESSTNTIKPQ